MKTSIATVTLGGDFRQKLIAVAEAGFDGVEFFETDFLAFDGSPGDVGRMVKDHGLEISILQPFRDFEGMPPEKRQVGLDRAQRKFDLMEQLGTELMLVCSNTSPDALGGIDRAADDLAQLAERAAKRNMRIGFEALAWGRHVSDHRDAWEIVRRANRDNLGLILDSFHTLSRKIDVDSIRAIPGDKLFYIHLADAPRIDMDLLYWSRHFRCMPGQGDLDVLGFARAVAATGYDGYYSLEIFNDQFRSGAPRTTATDGRRSLTYLFDQAQRAEPGVNVGLKDLPNRIAVRGFEFVEFAANDTEAKDLCALLVTMGFEPSGHHISKRVQLWRQGAINIVVNTDLEGFAHAFYNVHGTNVCDIGLRVDDAAATVKRAGALGSKMFSQPLGPAELDIPAIRSVGGGVMHFIDPKSRLARVWEIEFAQEKEAPSPQGAGLLGFDHVAQTMNYGELLTWQLFYTSLFETRKTPIVDVVDPGGLVRSQVIENDSGTLRLTLNGADNHRTLAGRFLAESFGSTVQHVAFCTNDIFATAELLKILAFKPLEVSPNYYADIAARFSLGDQFVDQLKTNRLLYDRDEGGEYFQLYSQTYGDGFFFEIVERRGNYCGYGASNAQFRIAAQVRAIVAESPIEEFAL